MIEAAKDMVLRKIYVTPKELTEEFEKSVENNEPTKKLLALFTKIAKHYATKYI